MGWLTDTTDYAMRKEMINMRYQIARDFRVDGKLCTRAVYARWLYDYDKRDIKVHGVVKR
jgi:hypothetical protein